VATLCTPEGQKKGKEKRNPTECLGTVHYGRNLVMQKVMK